MFALRNRKRAIGIGPQRMEDWVLCDEAGELVGARRAKPAGQAQDLGARLKFNGNPLESFKEKLENGLLLAGVDSVRTLGAALCRQLSLGGGIVVEMGGTWINIRTGAGRSLGLCADWRVACGEGGNQAVQLMNVAGVRVGGSAETGRAQALVSVAQERRAETPLANGHGTVIMDDIAEEEREGEWEKGLELRALGDSSIHCCEGGVQRRGCQLCRWHGHEHEVMGDLCGSYFGGLPPPKYIFCET